MLECPGSLNDSEWEIIRPLLLDCPNVLRGRSPEHSRRKILKGIFYVACGLILALKVTLTDIRDRDGARQLLGILVTAYSWLELSWADGGYAGQLGGKVANLPRHRQIELEIFQRSDDVKGFKCCRSVGSWNGPSAGRFDPAA